MSEWVSVLPMTPKRPSGNFEEHRADRRISCAEERAPPTRAAPACLPWLNYRPLFLDRSDTSSASMR